MPQFQTRSLWHYLKHILRIQTLLPTSATTFWFLTIFTSSLDHFNGSLYLLSLWTLFLSTRYSDPGWNVRACLPHWLWTCQWLPNAFRVKAKVLTMADKVLRIWPLFMALILSPSALPLIACLWPHFSPGWSLDTLLVLPKGCALTAPSAWNALCPESCLPLSFTSIRSMLIRDLFATIAKKPSIYNAFTKAQVYLPFLKQLKMVPGGRRLSCKWQLWGVGSFPVSLWPGPWGLCFSIVEGKSDSGHGKHHWYSASLERKVSDRATRDSRRAVMIITGSVACPSKNLTQWTWSKDSWGS